MQMLLGMAADRGLRVCAAHLPPGIMGYYSPDESRIYFDIRLTPSERRTTIAHELGHHDYGHRGDSPRNERLADSYAADLLIHPWDYAALELADADTAQIAEELCVTEQLVRHYQENCIQRVGDRVIRVQGAL
jgi:Zn-dependent peptidase ImmA (M78 family)